MVAAKIPASPEGVNHAHGDLPTNILDKVTEFSEESDLRFGIHDFPGRMIEFDEAVEEDVRWSTVERQKSEALTSLSDYRLTDIVSVPSSPERVFWRDPDGRPIETVLIRFNERFSLATEVVMDDKGAPLTVCNSLWEGDEVAVHEMLESYSVKSGGSAVTDSDQLESTV